MKTNQGGSVQRFVLIGSVMAVLLLSAAYVLHQLTTVQSAVSQQPQVTPSSQASPGSSGASNVIKNPEQNKPRQQNPSSSTDGTNTLPKTGAGDGAAVSFVLAALTILSISYVRSRRPELSL